MSSGHVLLDQLSGHLFWDVDRDRIDPETHARFLISRIMDRGTREDVRAAWSYYGGECIREALVEAPSLGSKTISFFANQFALPKEAFRAYQRSSNWSQ
jgi:hypothetical protein